MNDPRNQQITLEHFLNPFTPKISLAILLTFCHTNLIMLVWRSGIGSTNYPLIYIFFYFPHLSDWYRSIIVRRNSVLNTWGSWRVKDLYLLLTDSTKIPWQFQKRIKITVHMKKYDTLSKIPFFFLCFITLSMTWCGKNYQWNGILEFINV